jgi:Bacterial PH domain
MPSDEAAGAAVGPTELRWRVPRGMSALKAGGVLVFALLALFSLGDRVRLVVAGLAALVLATYALRDLLAPVRLAADPEGVTVVAGFAGRRRLAWSQVERVRVDERRRLGVRSQLLEIDTGDSLHLFSQYDLDAPLSEVADALVRLRTGGRS